MMNGNTYSALCALAIGLCGTVGCMGGRIRVTVTGIDNAPHYKVQCGRTVAGIPAGNDRHQADCVAWMNEYG
jgi:hypothetical protein